MRQFAYGLVAASIAIATAAVVTPPAQAQLINPFGKYGTTEMSSEDRAMMRKAMRDALEEYRVDATRTWASKKSGRAGKATVTRIFEQSGMKCAQLTHVFTEGPGNNYTAPLCKAKDGTWKLAF